jgi:hypothetical protein
MFEIREMTGQTYRDHYAGERVETSTDVPVIAHPGSVTDPVPARSPERELVGVK